ncbi:hypothetical protein LTR78_009906 [Recurvomyces mirabilis]|uniref:Uncharacterized protein n=1 Tax=Recurvomyces mirabilis TaxID=574656 RepID=A0AAE0WF90_9PEZI|nr:hypothetical protein LTR78_009906 [Recurvomyces mirabilis]KAK5150581.1 hypothetical protein LTS14_010075 [Recurvomyces mirabilis]
MVATDDKLAGVAETIRAHGQDDVDARKLQDLGYKQQLHVQISDDHLLIMLISTAYIRLRVEPCSVHKCDCDLGVLANGGPVALVYGFVFCFIGTLATCASLAENASIYQSTPRLNPDQELRSIQLTKFRYTVPMGGRAGAE